MQSKVCSGKQYTWDTAHLGKQYTQAYRAKYILVNNILGHTEQSTFW